MNRASFALAMCAAVSPLAGQGDDSPELVAPAVQTVVRLTNSRFEAVNHTSSDRLLVFSDALGPVTWVQLPAGGELDYTFAPGSAQGIWLETFVLGEESAPHSAPIALQLDDADIAFWIQTTSEYVGTWRETPQGMQLTQLTQFGTPAAPEIEAATYAPAPAPPHVPVSTPDGTPPRDEPPELDDEPLPPV